MENLVRDASAILDLCLMVWSYLKCDCAAITYVETLEVGPLSVRITLSSYEFREGEYDGQSFQSGKNILPNSLTEIVWLAVC